MITKAEKFGRKVLDKYTECITDQFLLYIQSDARLLKEYRAIVREASNNRINILLGKMIAEAYHLESAGVETNPECTLITKYTKHKIKREYKAITDDVPEMYRGSNLFDPPKDKKVKRMVDPRPKAVKPKKQKGLPKAVEETALF